MPTSTTISSLEWNVQLLQNAKQMEIPSDVRIISEAQGNVILYVPIAHDEEGRITALKKVTVTPPTKGTYYLRLEINTQTNKKKIIGISFDRNNRKAFQVLQDTINIYNGIQERLAKAS